MMNQWMVLVFAQEEEQDAVAYLALGQESAGAGARLVHDALPRFVIRHHGLLQSPLRLNPATQQKQEINLMSLPCTTSREGRKH
jgi:hypothetical protein